MAEINPEQAFYTQIYNDQVNFPNYGHTSHGEPYFITILDMHPTSWLDVGCGHNHMIKECRENKYIADVLGVDFACPSADQNCDMLDLPFADNRWDVVSAFDVMEHLLPEQVDTGLSEMARVGKRFIFTISYYKALTEINGKNAHPTVWSADKWIAKIEQYGTINDMSQTDKGFFIGEWKGL